MVPRVSLEATPPNGCIAPFLLIWAMDERQKALEQLQAMLKAGADFHALWLQRNLHPDGRTGLAALILAAVDPEKKRAGSFHARLSDWRAASLTQMEPLKARDPATIARKLSYRDALRREDLNAFQAPNADHPFHWPIRAKNDSPKRLWLMLQARAAVTPAGLQPTSPLHVLAAQKHKDAAELRQMVRLLEPSGSRPEALNHRNLTPVARPRLLRFWPRG